MDLYSTEGLPWNVSIGYYNDNRHSLSRRCRAINSLPSTFLRSLAHLPGERVSIVPIICISLFLECPDKGVCFFNGSLHFPNQNRDVCFQINKFRLQ